MQIANADEDGIQQALCHAYEDKTLRGRKLLTVRRMIERVKPTASVHTGVRRKNDRLQSAEGAGARISAGGRSAEAVGKEVATDRASSALHRVCAKEDLPG